MLKGQVSIFVVIGIVIISVIGIGVYFYGGAIGSQDLKFEEVHNYVQNCLEEVSSDSVNFVSSQGGYYVPTNSIYYYPYLVQVYMDGSKVYVPSKVLVESQISKYIENNIDSCIGDFNEFNGLNVSFDGVEVESSIYDSEVKVNSKIFVSVSNGEESENFEDFDYIVKNTKILDMIELSNFIVEEESKHKGSVCFSCLNGVYERYGVSVDVLEGNNSDIVYVVYDNEENLLWAFGMIYDFPSCENMEVCLNELS